MVEFSAVSEPAAETGDVKFWYPKCPVLRPTWQVEFAVGKWRGRQAHTELNEKSLQLGVFCFGSLQDGDVRVGVFPEREESFV